MCACVLKLFGLGAALVFALAVSLWTDVVYAQDKIAVYRVQPLLVTRDSVLKLAREAFGMTSPQVTEDSVTFVLEQEQKRLTIWKGSGAISFSDDSKLWNPDYHPSLPSESDAIRLALDFLKKHGLLIPQADPDKTGLAPQATVRSMKTKTRDGSDYVENHWLVSFPVVSVEPGSAGIPFGVELGLRLGSGGELLGFSLPWQGLEASQRLPLLPQDEAIQLLKQKLGTDTPRVLGEPRLLYAYAGEQATYHYPIYAIMTAEAHSMGGYAITATSFSPLVRIVSPREAATFPERVPIEFRAQIFSGFGTPPYRYLWLSSVDGPLGNAAVLRKPLSVGQHTITLVVTDRNGVEDAQAVMITVGSPSALATLETAALLAGPADLKVASSNGRALWVGGFALASLLLGVGALLSRRGSSRARWLLFVVVGSSLWLLASSSAQQTTSCPKPGDVVVLKDQAYKCSGLEDGRSIEANVTVINSTDGITINDLRVGAGRCNGTCYVLKELSVPFVEVETGGKTYKFELGDQPRNPKMTSISMITCAESKDDKGNPMPYGVKLDADYQGLAAKGTNITLDVTESFRFYVRSKCRFTTPEFMPQLSYRLNNVPPATKVTLRIPFYFDFDLDGTGKKGEDTDDDVAVMVREPIWEFHDVAGLTRSPILNCTKDNVAPRLVSAGGRSIIDCVNPNPAETDPDKGRRVKAVEFMNADFDNYHQADEFLTVPLCTNLEFWLGAIPTKWTLCAHLHQYLPQIQQRLKQAGIELHAKFYALQYHDNKKEKELAKIADLDTMKNGEQLKDIVFWYVVEVTHEGGKTPMTGTLFLDAPFFPAYWAGFSCGKPLLRLGLPAC